MIERTLTTIAALIIAATVAHALAYQLHSVREGVQARYRAAVAVAVGE